VHPLHHPCVRACCVYWKLRENLRKLKLLQSYFRSTKGKSRLSELSILPTENDFAQKLPFGDTFLTFASVKANKPVDIWNFDENKLVNINFKLMIDVHYTS